MKNNLLLLSCVCASLIFADDQVVVHNQVHDSVKKSSFINMLTNVARYINQKIGIDAHYKDASQFYQELAQEAQNVVGVASEDQLAVKRLENVGNFSLI